MFASKPIYIAWSLQWSSDVVEKREFAGKQAKLAAAELAKLSRRVGEQISFLFIFKIAPMQHLFNPFNLYFFQTVQRGSLFSHLLLPR